MPYENADNVEPVCQENPLVSNFPRPQKAGHADPNIANNVAKPAA